MTKKTPAKAGSKPQAVSKPNDKIEMLKSTFDFYCFEMGQIHKCLNKLGVVAKDADGNHYTASQRLRMFTEAYTVVKKAAMKEPA